MTKTPYSLAEGNFKPDDISIIVSESNLILTPEIEKRLEEIWDQELIKSRERGKEIFNGTSYRLNNWRLENGQLHLDLAEYDFKHRHGMIILIRQGEIDEYEYIHGGCFVTSTVKTADGKFVMVKLSGKSTNTNVIEMLGGMAETDVAMTSDGSYLFNALYQELEEEAGITQSDILKCTLKMLYAGTTSHFAYYFETELAVTENDLIDRFKDNADIDIDSLIFLSKEEYLETLRNHKPNKQLISKVVSI